MAGVCFVSSVYCCVQAASRLAGLKRYFAVDTSYVFKKLLLIMFPYTHRVCYTHMHARMHTYTRMHTHVHTHTHTRTHAHTHTHTHTHTH